MLFARLVRQYLIPSLSRGWSMNEIRTGQPHTLSAQAVKYGLGRPHYTGVCNLPTEYCSRTTVNPIEISVRQPAEPMA